jgi:hypothetical protein
VLIAVAATFVSNASVAGNLGNQLADDVAAFNAMTGSIMDMFDFNQAPSRKLILDANSGSVDSKTK